MNKVLFTALLAVAMMGQLVSAQASEAAPSKAKVTMVKSKTVEKKVKVKAKKKKAYRKREMKTPMIAKHNIVLRSMPDRKGKIVGHMKKGAKIELQWCDTYGWCKLKGKNEFTSRYALKNAHLVKKAK